MDKKGFERRWFKVGAGAAVGVTTILGLFYFLIAQYGFQIVDQTGDIKCSGTFEDPCISEFTVRNPTKYNIDIYSSDQVKLEFNPSVKDYALFVKDRRCSATGSCRCELKDGRLIGFEDWRCVDFTNATKPRQDTKYVYRFSSYSSTEFLLVGLKNNPNDNVKWGFGVNSSYLDPFWYAVNESDLAPAREAMLYERQLLDNSEISVDTSLINAQTFTIGASGLNRSHILQSVTVYLKRDSGSIGNLTLGVRATNASGYPTGNDLINSTINVSSIGLTTSPINIPFSQELTLQEGTAYALILSATGTDIIIYLRTYESPTNYAGGNWFYSYDGGSTWTPELTFDYQFLEYGYFPRIKLEVGTSINITANLTGGFTT